MGGLLGRVTGRGGTGAAKAVKTTDSWEWAAKARCLTGNGQNICEVYPGEAAICAPKNPRGLAEAAPLYIL